MDKPARRIAISGDPGSGKTTFSKKVADMTGYELITTGNIFRELAREKGVTLTELNKMAETQKEIDHKVDHFLEELNIRHGNYVLDSRMAWHFVKGAYKIRLTVAPEIAAQRIYADNAQMREKYDSATLALSEVNKRRDSEIARYKSLYGVDISDEKNFDLVINTSAHNLDEIMAIFQAHYTKTLNHSTL